MGAEVQHRVLLRLLFDPALRQRFEVDREQVLAELDPEDAAVFRPLNTAGLAEDAAGRARYLCSALCRAYPWTSAALGAAPGGRERIAAFLASPALFAAERSAAFGDHLASVLTETDAPSEAILLLEAVLSFERGLVDNAAALRAATLRGEAPPPPEIPTNNQLKRRPLVLPAFSLVAVLPVPTAILQAALDGVGPEDAWHRILAGSLSFARFVTVARADPSPVTLLCRGLVGASTVERGGAGGVGPLIEVQHRRAELRGRRDAWLAGLNGTMKLADLPPAQQRLARKLLEAGLLTVG